MVKTLPSQEGKNQETCFVLSFVCTIFAIIKQRQ